MFGDASVRGFISFAHMNNREDLQIWKYQQFQLPPKSVDLFNSDIARAFPGASLYRRQLVIACQARRSVGVFECLSNLPSSTVQFVSCSGCAVDRDSMVEVRMPHTRTWYIWVDLDLYGLSAGVWTCHTCYRCRGGKVSSRILWRFYQVFLWPHTCL